MYKVSIIPLLLLVVFGFLFNIMAASGSFGEYASLNECHCLLFNSTVSTNKWTLYNTYNQSISFYITKPTFNGIVVNTSIINGSISPNSTYAITVTVSGNLINQSNMNLSGYLTAYTATNQNSSGVGIQIATTKSIEIKGINKIITTITSTSTIPEGSRSTIIYNETNQSNNSSVNSSSITTTIQPTKINTSSSTILPTPSNYNNSSSTTINAIENTSIKSNNKSISISAINLLDLLIGLIGISAIVFVFWRVK